jgi:hypothetical protein
MCEDGLVCSRQALTSQYEYPKDIPASTWGVCTWPAI